MRFSLKVSLPNIRTVAEEMARINFKCKLQELEKNKFAENLVNKSYNNNPFKIKKSSSNIKMPIQRINNKLYKNESDSPEISSNLIMYKSVRKPNIFMAKSIKIQEGNANTNLNSNIKIATNLINNLSTKANNNNINTKKENIIINEKENENDLYSDKSIQNYPINENSSNSFIIKKKEENKEKEVKNENKEKKIKNENKEKNDNNTINKNNNIKENKGIENSILNKEDIKIEFINPELLSKYQNDSFSDITNNNLTKINKKIKKSKHSKSTLYEREMRFLNRKNNKLNKMRELFLKLDELNNYRQAPEIDPTSENIILGKEKYIPIEKRALEIHSLKMNQRYFYEEKKKIEKKRKEEEDFKNNIKVKYKNFDQDDWDNFIERQYFWKDVIDFKKNEVENIRNQKYKKYFFKPKINNRSKSILKSLKDRKDIIIEEIFERLFNDFHEHQERQKFRNDESKPTFKPIILKNKSKNNIKNNIIPCKSAISLELKLRNNEIVKKKLNIANHGAIENKNNEKSFNKFCKKNIVKYVDNKIVNKKSS